MAATSRRAGLSRRQAAIGATAALAAPWAARAQADFPSRLVTIVVPYSPGGATDVVARLLAQQLTATAGQTFIVENKTGANGAVAMQDVVRSADGYRWLVGNVTTNLLTPVLHARQMPLDVAGDLAPVSMLAVVQNVLIATKVNFAPSTLAEVVAYAKENPGRINHSSAGIGSYTHLDFLKLQKMAGIRMVNIPNRAGAGSGSIELINGELQLSILNVSSALPLIRDGKVKAIAVTSDSRSPALPDVPSVAELGYAGLGTDNWNALFVPAKVSPELRRRIHHLVATAMNAPAVTQRLKELQFRPGTSETPEEFAGWLAAARKRKAEEVAGYDLQQ